MRALELFFRRVVFAVPLAGCTSSSSDCVTPEHTALVPIVGDAFDFFFKAHRMNADLLLERHVLGPSPLADWAVVVGTALVLLLLLAAPLVVAGLLISHLTH